MIARKVMLAVLLAAPAALVLAQDRPRADDRSGAKPTDAATSIDGTWTVVSCSKAGKAVDGADKMTVTVKDGVATFSGAGGADKTGGMRTVRLEFLSPGMLRATEAGADGKFGGTGGTGTGTSGTTDRSGTGGTSTPPAGGTGTADRSGAGTTGAGGSMSGVYVLTPDYFAVSVMNPAGATGTGTGGTSDRSGTSGTGGTGSSGQGTGDRSGAGSGSGAGTTGSPQMNTHMSVVLKRSGGADRR